MLYTMRIMKPFEPEHLPVGSLNWTELIPLIGSANRAIAGYEGVLYGVPNPDVLLSPLTTQEAVLSSRIEGTQAELEDVYKFEAGEEVSDNERRYDIQEIVNYRRALRRAEKLLKDKPLCLNTLLELHSILLDSVRGHNKARGRFRTIQNWIGPENTPIEQAKFVPPVPLRIMEHLTDWENYYHAEERDPLVQLAIVHAQFETIHPFIDGNGRIGRMLIPLFLYEKKLLSRPNFYLSAYLEAHRDEYVQRLRALGQPASWTQWVMFFLTAIDTQARVNSAQAKSIQDLYERLKKQIIGLTRSQYAVPLLDRLFVHPIFRSSDLTSRKDMPSTPMVMNMLRSLKDAGVLKVVREGGGSRPQILAFPELLNLCEGRKVY
jgi:cell filamentation protein, protein adenylyltransferase